MATMFSKCPQCGYMIAPGSPRCTNCGHTELTADQAGREQVLIEEYARREVVHKRNSFIFMGLLGAIGALSLFLVIAAFWEGFLGGHRAPYEATTEAPNDGQEGPDVPEKPKETVSAGLFVWGMLLGLLVWVGLGISIFMSNKWFPRELYCPGCNVRVDEVGLQNGLCPNCEARLR